MADPSVGRASVEIIGTSGDSIGNSGDFIGTEWLTSYRGSGATDVLAGLRRLAARCPSHTIAGGRSTTKFSLVPGLGLGHDSVVVRSRIPLTKGAVIWPTTQHLSAVMRDTRSDA